MSKLHMVEGEFLNNMFTLKLDIFSNDQVLIFEYFIVRNWLRKKIKNQWYVECDNSIKVSFKNKKDLCKFKLHKISSRYMITNL